MNECHCGSKEELMWESSEGDRQRENKVRMISSEHLNVMSEPSESSSNFVYAAVTASKTRECPTHVRCSACDR